jgi:CubicO group peptidase (beta-lactamase class C family)
MSRLAWGRVATLGVLILLLLAVPPAANELADQIDAILAESYPADGPGAAVIAVRDGQVVYRGARGMADLENGLPLTPDSVFRLGSITKQFTGACIMLLVERGELKLSDPLSQFLPDYPVHGHTISVEHLLTHTSGIFNYTNIPGYMQAQIKSDLSTEELVDAFKDQEMNFAPGEAWSYSNSGYVLLGAIIEQVSGLSYELFVQRNIFDVLGMDHSYYGSQTRIIPNRARGYGGGPGNWSNAEYLSMTQPHAAGSLLSTVDDMARWDAALYTDKLLQPDSVKRMMTKSKLNGGEETTYGLGFGVGTLRSKTAISHGGGIHGFSTYATRLPDERIYVAVLTNAPGLPVRPTTVGDRIAALLAGDPFESFKRISLDAEVLQGYVGVYRIDEDSERIVSLDDGQLFTQRSGGARLPAHPHSRTGFFYDATFSHFEFVLDDAGEALEMLMYQNGGDVPERAQRVSKTAPEKEVAEIDPAIYDGYVGEYELQPGFTLTVTREDDRLFAQATGQSRAELFAESETAFFLKVVDARVVFTPGPDGRAVQLVLHQGGQEITAKRID